MQDPSQGLVHVLERRGLFFHSVMTVFVLIGKTRAVSRIPLAFIAISTLWCLLAATVPLLALTGEAMADNSRPLAVGTVQDLENHDAPRSRWGCSAAKTLRDAKK